MKAAIQLTDEDRTLLREQHIAWEIEEFEARQCEESSLERTPWGWRHYAVWGAAMAGGLWFWWWVAKSAIRLFFR